MAVLCLAVSAGDIVDTNSTQQREAIAIYGGSGASRRKRVKDYWRDEPGSVVDESFHVRGRGQRRKEDGDMCAKA